MRKTIEYFIPFGIGGGGQPDKEGSKKVEKLSWRQRKRQEEKQRRIEAGEPLDKRIFNGGWREGLGRKPGSGAAENQENGTFSDKVWKRNKRAKENQEKADSGLPTFEHGGKRDRAGRHGSNPNYYENGEWSPKRYYQENKKKKNAASSDSES